MRLVLIGVGLFPHPVAGDKNFFTRLIPLLAGSCESIDILSLNDRSGRQEEVTDGCRVTYHNIERAFHFGDRGRFFSGRGALLDYYHKHQPPREISEILLTTIVQLPRLKRLVAEKGVEIVHFMDNMGPSMRLVKRALPRTMVTHSAMAYTPSGTFYDKYIRFSMASLDKIVPYSRAYAERLRELGIDPCKIEVIRWGVEPKRNELNVEKKEQVRAAYGVPADARLLLWSGFILQIRESDFRAAVNVARKVVEVRPNCRFIFAFKPRSFRAEFKTLESEAIRVETNVERFAELVEAADLFYSPLLELDKIVGPPLTWLEAMSVGTPVITTAAGGVDEIIEHRRTGFVARSLADLTEVVIDAVDFPELVEVSRNCRRFAAEHCNIRTVADKYLRLWSKAEIGRGE